MPDITQLILDDHEVFRRQFAALDTTNDPDQLRAIWKPLANLLDVHAVAEETIFYPQLLRHGDDAEEETVDAVGDHNDIRDAAHEAEQYPVGSERWWDAVWRTRMANSAHMAEEEDEALADFRRNSPLSLRDELGAQFLKFKADHPDARTLDTSDKDPEQYVSEVQEEIAPDGGGDGASGSGPGSGHVRGPGSGPGGGPGGSGPGGSGHGLGIGSLKGR